MMTQARVTVLPLPILSDCLLHRTHHTMRAACWGTLVDWYMERSVSHPDESWREHADMYWAQYERALLDDHIAAHTRQAIGRQIARDFNGA